MFNFFSQSPSQISAQEVEQLLQGASRPFLLDVREPDEYQQGRVPGSTLIPLATLPARLNELPRDQRIIAVCRSGARSGMASEMLRKAGLDALNMAGGMNAWRGPVER